MPAAPSRRKRIDPRETGIYEKDGESSRERPTRSRATVYPATPLPARCRALPYGLPRIHYQRTSPVRHMKILVLNVGSSTLKFQLIATDGDAIAAARDQRLARGTIERIGGQAI